MEVGHSLIRCELVRFSLGCLFSQSSLVRRVDLGHGRSMSIPGSRTMFSTARVPGKQFVRKCPKYCFLIVNHSKPLSFFQNSMEDYGRRCDHCPTCESSLSNSHHGSFRSSMWQGMPHEWEMSQGTSATSNCEAQTLEDDWTSMWLSHSPLLCIPGLIQLLQTCPEAREGSQCPQKLRCERITLLQSDVSLKLL